MALSFSGNGRFLTVTGDGAADFYQTQSKRFEDIKTGGGSDYIIAVDNIRTAGRGRGLSKPNPLFLVGDTIDAGAGDDLIESEASFGFLIGGDGDDRIVSTGQPRSDSRELEIYGDDAEVPGTSGHGNDTIVAGVLNEIIDGGGGRDRVSYEFAPAAIRAFLSDQVFGLVQGGSGTDTLIRIENITGSDFGDLINGNAGGNRLDGGDGNDTISGNGGGDTILGGNGNDSLRGGAGGDAILGDAGEDSLFGDGGNDTITGGADADRISGGDGDDTISGDGGNDLVSGGFGADVIVGGPGGDTLFGNFGNDRVLGQDGQDSIEGSSGNDTLEGGANNDTVRGGTGADSVLGGTGRDLLDGETGDDTVSGGKGSDTVLGGAGNDSLSGGSSGDRIEGGSGRDTVNGGSGGDTLRPGSGDDTVDGGTGLDLISYSDSVRPVFINIADGLARIEITPSSIELDRISNVENADGSGFDDFIFGDAGVNVLRGLRGADAISGLDGNDTIRGGRGSDTVFGNLGNDSLEGNSGVDFIFGGFGNDTINGGSGRNAVAGGPGSDRLIATSGETRFVWGPQDFGLTDLDRIEGFDVVNDAIVMSGVFDVATADAAFIFRANQVGSDAVLSVDLSLTPNEEPGGQEARDFVVLENFDASTIDFALWQNLGIVDFV